MPTEGQGGGRTRCSVRSSVRNRAQPRLCGEGRFRGGGRRGHPGAGPHDGAGPRASSAPPLLTEIGRLHRVVEVLGRPRRHAVWASDPWGKGAASCPVRAGPGPRLMSQNVHQSPGRGRGMVSGLGAAGRDGEGGRRPLSPPLLTFAGILVRLDFSPLATPLASVSLSSACLRVPPTHFPNSSGSYPLCGPFHSVLSVALRHPEPGTLLLFLLLPSPRR